MIALVVLIVSIALVDSLNPATVVPALYFATATRPVRSILGFAAGFFTVNVVGGLVVLGLGQGIAGLIPRPRPELLHWGELVLGLALLIGGALLWCWRRKVGAGFARLEPETHRFAPVAGVTIAAAELPTAFPYLIAIAALAASGKGLAVQVALLVTFQVIFLAPVVAIAIARAMAGPRTVHALARSRAFLLRSAGAGIAAFVLALGVALVILGAAGLVSL